MGATANGNTFLDLQTRSRSSLLGVFAFGGGTAGGVLLGKLMYKLTGGKVNPLIGSAGVSAVPMAARVSQKVGQEENPGNFLLMHAMGPNVAGVIGSAVAAGVFLALFGNRIAMEVKNHGKSSDYRYHPARRASVPGRHAHAHWTICCPRCEILDKVGYYSLECWGGATFDTCLRFLNEDPWERLRKLRKALPNTKLQMLLRGQNILGYKHYADDVVEEFVKQCHRKRHRHHPHLRRAERPAQHGNRHQGHQEVRRHLRSGHELHHQPGAHARTTS